MRYRRTRHGQSEGLIRRDAFTYILAGLDEDEEQRKSLVASYADRGKLNLFVYELATLAAGYLNYSLAFDLVLDSLQQDPEAADTLLAAHLHYFNHLDKNRDLVKIHIREQIEEIRKSEIPGSK